VKNLLHESHDYQPIEAIDLARGQLDYAAMAAGTPSIKHILFKAQTMGPLSAKPSPWKMTVAAGVAVAAVGVVAWPWIPVHSSLSILQVGFEQAIPRAEAQRLVSKLLRSGEPEVVLGAEFNADSGRSDEADGGETGRLRISLLGAGMGAQRIQDSYTEKIREASERQLDPLFQVSSRLRETEWRSPLQIGLERLGRENRGLAADAGDGIGEDQLAARVRGSTPLLKQALGEEIGALNRGFELRELIFLAPGEDAAVAGMDFSLPAWPSSVGVRISLYETLTVREQAQLRSLVESFLSRSGLGPGQASLASAPQDWLPIMVRVFRSSGRYDRRLSEQLQAWIVQPEAAETHSVQFEPTAYVDEAMQRYLPGISYTMDSNDEPARQSDGQTRVEFNVRLGGAISEMTELERQVSALGQSEGEGDSGQDW
jgi:hypothetical protein